MSNIIVMAFSPRNIVGCFWGGHGHPRTPLATPLKSEVFEKRLRHGVGSSLARARDKTKQTHCDCSTTAWSSCKNYGMFPVACVAGVKRGGRVEVTFKREIKRSHFAPEFNGVFINLPSGKRF